MAGPHMFSGGMMVESMRSGPYVQSVLALAEIIDNSIEAGAKHIDILCQSKMDYGTNRTMLEEVAVADDGEGMTVDGLASALVFGNTTRRDSKGRTKGIGKFGMGLPNSSITQCRRVTVYSWTKKGEVFSTCADLDEIAHSNDDRLPTPVQDRIPDKWIGLSDTFCAESGTLVVWSKLDKFDWKRFSAFFNNSEHVIGRIYRRYIERKAVKIRMVDFCQNTRAKEIKKFRVNDPLYLTAPSSTPNPWNDDSMFEPYGEHWERKYEISGHKVVVRYTMVKKVVRPSDQTGRTPYGRHAAKNVGISLMRGDRELVLDDTIIDGDSRERWWGIEVEFPPALDEVFGVTYYKQGAHSFSNMIKKYKARQNDPDAKQKDDSVDDKLYEFVRDVCKQKGQMRERIRHMRADTRKQSTSNEGISGRYDTTGTTTAKQDTQSRETKKIEITKVLEPTVFQRPEAEREAERLVNDDQLKVVFYSRALPGNRILFEPEFAGTKVIIKMNTNHPAYKNMISLVEEVPDSISIEETKEHLSKIHWGFQCLFASWANMEDKEENSETKVELQNVRHDWGTELARFIESR